MSGKKVDRKRSKTVRTSRQRKVLAASATKTEEKSATTLFLNDNKGMSVRVSGGDNTINYASSKSYLFAASNNNIVTKYEEAVCGRVKAKSDSVVERWIASE